MTGTVTKRVSKSGTISYLIRVDLGVIDGQRKRHVETCHTGKKDADIRLRELIKQFEQGTLTEPSQMSVNEFFEKWLSESAAHGRKVRTLIEYRGIFERYIKTGPKRKKGLGNNLLSKVTPLQVQEFVNELARRLSPQTVRTAFNVVKVAFKQARRWLYIPFNPAADIDLPKKNDQPTIRAMDGEEVQVFIAALVGHLREAVLQTALASGARPGEYLALRWPDLNTVSGSIKIERAIARPKGGGWIFQSTKTKKSRRTIPLPPEVIAMLKQHRIAQIQERLMAGPAWTDNDLIFANQFGNPLNNGDLSRVFKRILKKAGLPGDFRLYDLRHTCATLMLASGINPKVASERLGHSTVNLTLDTYSSVLPTMQAEATDRIGAAMFGGRRVLRSV